MPITEVASPLLRLRAGRLIAAGLLAGIAVLGLGRVGEWTVLGRTEAAARDRLESRGRAAFAAAAADLDARAAVLAAALDAEGAPADGPDARARLFDAAARAVAGSDVALTVQDPTGRVLAWAGRPSLSDAGVDSRPVWSVSAGALGPRIQRLLPVGTPAIPRGLVLAERPLAEASLTTQAEAVPIALPGAADLPIVLAPHDPARSGTGFLLEAPDGTPLLDGAVAPDALASRRAAWRANARLGAGLALALGLLLAAAAGLAAGGTIGPLGAVALARLSLALAGFDRPDTGPLLGDAEYASPLLWGLLRSPYDFLLTAGAAAAMAAVLAGAAARWHRTSGRRTVAGTAWLRYLPTQLAAGAALAALLLAQQHLVADTVAHAQTDLLRFSMHPWDTARLALQAGLVLWHAAAALLAVAGLRAGLLGWRAGRGHRAAAGLAVAAWLAPAVALALGGALVTPAWLGPLVTALAAAWWLPRLAGRFRHGSQALRLALGLAVLTLPALAAYPLTARLVRDARAELIAARYAPQALDQRETIQRLLADALTDIDASPALAGALAQGGGSGTDAAFALWRATPLAAYPVTSSVEIYDAAGGLAGRYAFNLPDDLAAPPSWSEASCRWALFEEVSPFFADQRLMLHAGRAVCDPDGARRGSIVVHAVLDYENLPFIPSANPYLQLVGATDPLVGEGLPAEGLEYAVYGWSRTPLYASADRAWPLPEDVFAQVQASRTPVGATLARGGRSYDAYLVSDRFGIYALGLPVATPLEHAVNLAELAVLAAGVFVALLLLGAAGGRLARIRATGGALVREVRASFYRKLFLAFVAATVAPVLVLAVVARAYVAGELRAGVEQEAVRTALAARRVVEDLAAPRAAQQGVGVDDNLLVWVSRLIDQDANVFADDLLLATSERNLFSGGLLSPRTPADLYRALVIDREGTAVSIEQLGASQYLVAATPLPAVPFDAVLTVPLTSQQQAIERQIDTLDRRVLLAVLLLVFTGAGLGYSMAERIADPVNRLTRATRRLARGDLDTRITPTSSDELRRLVEDFNQMADELRRQRGELERRHRLAAWAEMASQVAHEIKNPLTPIQLHAEHLRRVHEDQGAPLGAVVAESTGTILDQVRLLRRIASDFSSFSTTPTAHPGRVDVLALVDEVLAPYRDGLAGRIAFEIDAPAGPAEAWIDRTLVARALTNVVENAVHAIPGRGAFRVTVRTAPESVTLALADTGVGMDDAALARAFEPSFSTKMTGTGLGLPIARRNIELSGGTIGVRSAPGEGTCVTVVLPRAAAGAA